MNHEIDISRLIFVQSAQISVQTLGGAYALHSLGSPSLSPSLLIVCIAFRLLEFQYSIIL